MFTLRCDIQIGQYRFTRAMDVELNKSTDLIAGTALIKMPLTAVLNDEDSKTTVEIAKAIATGNAVSIQLYYEGYEKHAQTFTGYVKRINYKMPLEVECEDAIYLLRQKTITKSWQSTTLQAVLAEIISGTGITLAGDIPSITLEPFYLNDVNGAFALQKIKDEYGLTAYIDNDGALYCGLAYTENTGTVRYSLNGSDSNVVNADELKYHSKDDIRLKIKAIAISGDNTRTEVEVGDNDGQLKTLHFYNIKDAATLKTLAAKELDKLKFDGYEGKITAFLIPHVVPGMKAIITDDRFPDRGGKYFVEEVSTQWGQNGGRNIVKLGIELDE